MLLIHGSGSWGAEMAPLADALRPFTTSHAPNLIGHGGRPIPERFSMADFARDLVDYLDREGIERTFVTGYSSGGLVALYLARHYPQRVLGVCAIATKYVFDAKTVALWTYLSSEERYHKPGDARRPELDRIHAAQGLSLVAKTHARLYEDYGCEAPLADADLQAIAAPVLLVSSNRDQIVPWDETLALAKLLAHSEVVMFYGHAHPIEVVPLARVARAIAAWMEKVREA